MKKKKINGKPELKIKIIGNDKMDINKKAKDKYFYNSHELILRE